MGHKTLINGTAYEVGGGRALVNGTGYEIDKGRTLVNGTGYDIPFAITDPEEALRQATVVAQGGWSGKGTDANYYDVQFPIPGTSKTYYLFGAGHGAGGSKPSTAKFKGGTLTTLQEPGAWMGGKWQHYAGSTNITFAASQLAGKSAAIFEVPAAEEIIDPFLSGWSVIDSKATGDTTKRKMYMSIPGEDCYVCCFVDNSVCMYKYHGGVLTKVLQAGTVCPIIKGSDFYISKNGTSEYSAYSGYIVAIKK